MDWPINPKHVAYAFPLECLSCVRLKKFYYFFPDYINKLRGKISLSYIFVHFRLQGLLVMTHLTVELR